MPPLVETSTKKMGPKHESETDRALTLEVVAKYDRRGYTQLQIVEMVQKERGITLSQQGISLYLKQIRESYKQRVIEHQQDMLAEKLAQYAEIRREAWLAYEKSKEDGVSILTEKAPGIPVVLNTGPLKPGEKPGRRDHPETLAGTLQLLKEVVRREGRIPANEFLKTIMATLDAECRLLGLEAPKKLDVNAKVGFDWDELIRQANSHESNVVIVEPESVTPALEGPKETDDVPT